jgi:serine/threonine protein kinase
MSQTRTLFNNIRKPFFRGETPQHQLETIVSVIGLPSKKVLDNIRSEPIRKALHSGAECAPYPFKSYFPRDVNPVALDLLRKMLVFDPRERCTIEEVRLVYHTHIAAHIYTYHICVHVLF